MTTKHEGSSKRMISQTKKTTEHSQDVPFDWSLLDGRPVKHSLTLKGHRTSVSLEPSFWAAFRVIANNQGKSVNGLAMSIDENRGNIGLASAIRLYTLHQIMADKSK